MEIRKVQFTGGSSYIITFPGSGLIPGRSKRMILSVSRSSRIALITTAIDLEPAQRVKEFDW